MNIALFKRWLQPEPTPPQLTSVDAGWLLSALSSMVRKPTPRLRCGTDGPTSSEWRQSLADLGLQAEQLPTRTLLEETETDSSARWLVWVDLEGQPRPALVLRRTEQNLTLALPGQPAPVERPLSAVSC